MFKLPTTEKAVESTNPKNMLLYAHPKTGKTQALSGLQGNLIIDLEDGTEYVGGMVINVLAEAAKILKLDKPKQVYGHPEGMNTVLNILFEINKQLKEGDTKYKFISLDTATALIDVATHLATLMYKKSPIGKNYAGTNVVMDLPNGGGYMWLRDAFRMLLDLFEPYAQECFIMVGHVKDASVLKNGTDISARDIQLPGKLKSLVCQDAQAIGVLIRRNATQTILSFVTDERDLATGARTPHLAGKEFLLVEESPKGSRQFTYNWNQIFV